MSQCDDTSNRRFPAIARNRALSALAGAGTAPVAPALAAGVSPARENLRARDQAFMARALEIARLGEGLTAPNPMVGCVLARNGDVIGEGWHKGAGLPHAEAEALVAAGAKACGATAYVTLEPCKHFGRTPPCAEALISAGVAEVVYALADPHDLAGGGATRLQSAGIKVRGGVMEAAARDLNRAWLHGLRTGRPYVIAKAAMTLDGRIATRTGDSKWITGETARAKGHELRRAADAIVAGAGTIIADDPALTAREGGEIRHPLRVVVDSRGRTSPGARVYERGGKGALLATTSAAPAGKLSRFREHGVEALALPAGDDARVDLPSLLAALYRRGVVTALVEGGGELLGALLDADLVDEVALFVAPVVLGGGLPAFNGAGPARLADARAFEFTAPEALGRDLFIRGVRTRGGA
jgi:diaminohydroxyphosphoribosylaminopyrimidine deaminase/5-amino-6-(5-phosphoribosylamino)uracil reductase